MKKNKKLEIILAAVVAVIIILCAIVYMKGKGNEMPDDNTVAETTTVQETTKQQGIEVEENTGSDDGFSALIPIG